MRPHPGMMPTRAWVSAKRACSDATRKSHASAISNPPVTATPFTAPMSSLVRGGSAPRSVVPRSSRRARSRAPEPELLEVDARAERGIGAGEDHHVDRVVGLELERSPRGARAARRGSARCAPRVG